MRITSTLLCVLVLLGACSAQQSGQSTVTVAGCLMGINGSFKLLSKGGERLLLKGSHSQLFSYNGMLVEITGTIATKNNPATEAKPRTLHVTKIKKLADSCQ